MYNASKPIPTTGYFYTFLTNYSDNLVSFDNLTIRRKNGVVRAVKEYYPYGLEYGRYNGNFAYNAEAIYDRGYGGSSWQDKEWFSPSGPSPGLDLNYFEARYYDPVLGRWHAPDPLEQCHSPYLALLDDPANHIDPDGRSAWASLCGTAAYGAQSFTTVMNVSSAFSQTFGAFGGVMQFVTSSASIAGGLRMVKNLLDFVNGGAEFSEVAGNWGKASNQSNKQFTARSADNFNEENGKKSDPWPGLYNIFHKGPDHAPNHVAKRDLGWMTINVNQTVNEGEEIRVAHSTISNQFPDAVFGQDWSITGVEVSGADGGNGLAYVLLDGSNGSTLVGTSGLQNWYNPYITPTHWKSNPNAFNIQGTYLPFLNWRPLIWYNPFYWLASLPYGIGGHIGYLSQAQGITIGYIGPEGSSATITQVRVRVRATVDSRKRFFRGSENIQGKSWIRKVYDFIMYGK